VAKWGIVTTLSKAESCGGRARGRPTGSDGKIQAIEEPLGEIVVRLLEEALCGGGAVGPSDASVALSTVLSRISEGHCAAGLVGRRMRRYPREHERTITGHS